MSYRYQVSLHVAQLFLATFQYTACGPRSQLTRSGSASAPARRPFSRQLTGYGAAGIKGQDSYYSKVVWVGCLAGKTLSCVRQSPRLFGECVRDSLTGGACQVDERVSKSWLLLFFQQPALERIAHQRATAGQAELGHQPGLVGLDRLDAEAEHTGYMLIGVAQGD